MALMIGYLLGSVPVALLVGRRHGIDLLAVGDGNPGAWNALEHLGPRRAWPAFVGDGAKGLAAGLAGYALGDWWAAWAGVGGAMLGHAFPPWTRGRGGKAVMTFVGGAFALSPAAALVALALCGAVAWRRSFAWGSRAAVAAFPLVQLAFDPPARVIGTGVLMCLIAALFALRGTRGPATSAGGAPPTR